MKQPGSHGQAGRKDNAKSLYSILEASLVVSGYSPQHFAVGSGPGPVTTNLDPPNLVPGTNISKYMDP